jgi:NADH dehydrogenase [ubiquinone] 1 alpha subcomplex assembly factor 7
MTPLEREIRAIIETEGPMTVADFMRLCLTHPRHGYYVTRDPFGSGGDFITAPEVSQMFGELIGAWAATVWQQMGSPAQVHLAELGPGRGTLMADALRAAQAVPAFRAALSVHLVEISPALRARQEETLAGTGAVHWHETIESVPDGPAIVIANEFVDALRVHQFVKDSDGWNLRVVGLVGDKLGFLVAPAPMPKDVNDEGPDAPNGAILELRDEGPIGILSQRFARQGGAALIIDYGHATLGFGDTLQAVRHHQYADPLADPGEADLTTQVNFGELVVWARRNGAATYGPIGQGEFLRRLGIAERAARLKASATPAQAAGIDSAFARLTAPGQMGELFKVLAIADPKLGPLPGFDAE